MVCPEVDDWMTTPPAPDRVTCAKAVLATRIVEAQRKEIVLNIDRSGRWRSVRLSIERRHGRGALRPQPAPTQQSGHR